MKKKKKIIIIVGSVIIALALIFFVLGALRNKKPPERPSDNAGQSAPADGDPLSFDGEAFDAADGVFLLSLAGKP